MRITSNEKKTFCLDSSVLINNPYCLETFKEHNIGLITQMYEEIDGIKEGKGIRSFAARMAISNIHLLCQTKNENLITGIKTSGGGVIKFLPAMTNTKRELQLPNSHIASIPDNVILATVKKLQRENKNGKVVLVSLDKMMHVKANGYGIYIEDYKFEKKNFEKEKYSGYIEIILNKNEDVLLKNLREKKILPASTLEGRTNEMPKYTNQCCRIRSLNNDNYELAIFKKYDKDSKFIFVEKPCPKNNENQISPTDDRQCLYLALLRDPSIHIVVSIGKAGSGKSLIGLNYAYEELVAQNFPKIDVYRPMAELQEMGFLPGGVSEKFAPWQKPIADSFDLILPYAQVEKFQKEFLNEERKKRRKNKQRSENKEDFRQKETGFDWLMRTKKLEVNPISYLLGRTLHRRILVYDEFQHTNRSIIKVCVARAGQGTKLIINGDIHQIIEDAKGVYVNEYTNGLVHIINTLKGQQGFGCIELNGKSKRSEIAELSSLL